MSEIPFPEIRTRFLENPRSLLRTMPGIYPVDKPEGMSSHGAVARARKRLGLKRVGHGGTLDPLATGLLVLLAGNATRLFDELQAFPKTYVARLRWGVATDTQDCTGTVVSEAPVPVLDADAFERLMAPFRGNILQTPPMHSALKRDGKPLYELARAGITVEREPRPVTVYELSGRILSPTESELTMSVSSGFYVRTLIHDMGTLLGCGAMMTALRRTAIGPFTLTDACPPDTLEPGAPLADSSNI